MMNEGQGIYTCFLSASWLGMQAGQLGLCMLVSTLCHKAPTSSFASGLAICWLASCCTRLHLVAHSPQLLGLASACSAFV